MSTEGIAEIGDGLFRFEFASGLSSHSGIILGDDCAAVVDTGTFEADARILLEAVAGVTALPIRYVINTHHHGDHTFGNWWFRPAIAIGHERCRLQLVGAAGETHRRLLGEWMPEAVARMAAVPLDPPGLTFEDSLRLHLGRVTLRLDYFGRAHTDNDIVIAVEEQGLAFVGDVVGETLFGEDAYLEDWAPTLRRLLTIDESTYQPGHDPLVDRAFIESQVTAIEELASVCAAAASPEEALAGASAAARAAFGSQLEISVRRYFQAGA